LNGIFRPESLYNTTINVYCICIGRNIPTGNLLHVVQVLYCAQGKSHKFTVDISSMQVYPLYHYNNYAVRLRYARNDILLTHESYM